MPVPGRCNAQGRKGALVSGGGIDGPVEAGEGTVFRQSYHLDGPVKRRSLGPPATGREQHLALLRQGSCQGQSRGPWPRCTAFVLCPQETEC